MVFKDKFTQDPQLDGEGFVVLDAPCRGCRPDESCPRSGHCERYDSPLREATRSLGVSAWLAERAKVPSQVAEGLLMDTRCLGCMVTRPALLDYPNPKGWDEVDGVKLPAVTWADVANGRGTKLVMHCEPVRSYHDYDVVTGRTVPAPQYKPTMQGVQRLSDSSAMDAYFGWKGEL